MEQERNRRHGIVVETLRARLAEDREAREKRQRWYRQSLEIDSNDSAVSSDASLTRLYKFRTKVPCRVSAEASALLALLRKRFSGCTISFQRETSGQQALMLTGVGGTERKQIGWVEHYVETDPKLCNVRNQGLSVETDGESMLVLRFRYPQTGVRMTAGRSDAEDADNMRSVNFVEIRPALDQRTSEKGSSPRLVWLTRPELEVMNSLESRDFESFYVRFKLELQAGIWSALSGLLADLPNSLWYRGSCYTMVTEADATVRKIYQKTIDDSGRSADIGADRTYDAAPATDILLLYLESDILADIADIYFTFQSLGSSDSYSLKEEFFTFIRRFWASSQSLASRYGSDLATVTRMSQRAVPMPAQAPLLKQDWTNLRQSLVDRYGEGGRNAARLLGNDIHRPAVGPVAWPFSAFPPGEINLGLRFVYRQEWTHIGAERGDVIRVVPPRPRTEPSSSEPESETTARRGAAKRQSVETTIEQTDASTSLSELVDGLVDATVAAMKWPRDFDGGIHTGIRGLAVTTDMGLESESRERSREVSTRLSDITVRLATEIRDDSLVRENAEPDTSLAASEGPLPDDGGPTHVYSKLQNRYEVLTRPVEIQNVVFVAERLPTPTEIDHAWVRQHDWILAKVLLDESFRDALTAFGDEELDSKRQRFYDHLRANILHYQRAIWRQEDPQQRSMRYRKSGKKVPLEWRFELESGGALTVDELGDRLSRANVDGQFAAYSGGREADLDQVIDPSGPVGYYGNYAIYHMRPELGSADLFSMLHFFKSPYLRQNPETGSADVEDPAQIQLSENPFVGADLLRQERARRIALDTGGVVIDTVWSGDSSSQDLAEPDAASLLEMLEGCELISESRLVAGCGLWDAEVRSVDADSVLSHVVHTPGDSEPWIVVRDDRALRLDSLVQAGDSAADERLIHAPGDKDQMLEVGGAPNESAALVVFARDDGARMFISGDPPAHGQEGHAGIRPTADGDKRTDMHAGPAHDAAAPLIQPSEHHALTVTAAGATRVIKRNDQANHSGSDEASPIVAVPDSEAETAIIVRAGPAREDVKGEFVIFARNDEERTLLIGDGRSLDQKAEPGIVANSDEATVIRLLVGRRHASGAEWVIHRLGEERARVTSVADGRAHPHEQIVLAGGDDEWMTSLLAGAGVGRTHERVILGQDDGWLRPCLVAG